MMSKEQFEYLANQAFRLSPEAHKNPGPGLPESVYEYSLMKELQPRKIDAAYQVKIPLFYKGYNTSKEFFIDILVENEIIIEVKAADNLHPVHEARLFSYLKLADKKMEALINFNIVLIKDGFKRRVNNY